MALSTPTPASAPSGAERRRHKRFAVSRPGKVFRRATQQYAPIVTRNLSFSGALLEVESVRGLEVGEIVDVGVAYRSEAVVESRRLVQAIVTRTAPAAEGRQTVAVRYIAPQL